jgi:Protein of unknown function (DUF3500)
MTTMTQGFGVRPRPPISGRRASEPLPEFVAQTRARADAELARPFVGVTTDGRAIPDLFPLRPTGVSTKPLEDAARALLGALDAAQRRVVSFPLEDDAWRRWNNTHPYIMRHGLWLEQLEPARRERALALLEAGLSARGYETARNVMRLNHTIGEITGRWDEYGEWLYWLSLFGQPSPDEPWGWQIDGHHLIVNYFILRDQVVATPLFMGSEPTYADSGAYAGTRVFEAEERDGLAFARGLSKAQRDQAVVAPTILGQGSHAAGEAEAKRDNAQALVRMGTQPRGPRGFEGRIQGGALADNAVLPYQGIAASGLDAGQRDRLLELIEVYVGRIRDGHSAVKMAEVREHLAETRFAWMGGLEDDSVFYYRIHSPVLLIEFDHLAGIALDNDEPARTHIHTVVRTPNGNDYGKDLLRQHYARHHRDGGVGHAH